MAGRSVSIGTIIGGEVAVLPDSVTYAQNRCAFLFQIARFYPVLLAFHGIDTSIAHPPPDKTCWKYYLVPTTGLEGLLKVPKNREIEVYQKAVPFTASGMVCFEFTECL
jgi:hypothetical protein